MVTAVRVRPATAEKAASFSEAFEELGGTALSVGKTLELVHPSGSVGELEDVEIRFFIRAWSIATGDRLGSELRILEPSPATG